jgi:hypothetical protein
MQNLIYVNDFIEFKICKLLHQFVNKQFIND